MQTITEIANLITDKKYLFEIVLPGKAYKGLKISVENAKNIHGSVENYIKNVLKSNNADTGIVKLYSVNGTSFKQRGDHIIFLPKTETVATSATNVATSATNVATSATNVATSATNVATNKELGNLNDAKMLGVKETIEFEVLKVKHEMVTTDRDNLKIKVKELEKKVDDLQDEKLKLVKENGTAEEKHKLALERQQLESEREAKSVLSGIVEDLNANPELIKTIAGFINPNHPMFKESGVNGLPPATETAYHNDVDANNVLKELPKMFSNVEPALVIRFYTIAMEFVKEPIKVEQVFKTVYPNL